MYEQVEKTKKYKSGAVANSVAQRTCNWKQGFEFVNNGSEVLQMIGSRKGIIDQNDQLKEVLYNSQPAAALVTSVDYTAGSVNWSGISEVVGTGMNGLIGPNHPYGSAPVSTATPKNIAWAESKSDVGNSYIRGHLLNGHLGGPGVAKNLFPITASANHIHETHVESEIKDAVNNNKQWVHYQVNVADRGNGNSTFDCRWWYKQQNGSLGPENKVEVYSNRDAAGSESTTKTRAKGTNPFSDNSYSSDILSQGGSQWGIDLGEIEWSTENIQKVYQIYNSPMELLTDAQEKHFLDVMDMKGAYEVDRGLTTTQWNRAIKTVKETTGI